MTTIRQLDAGDVDLVVSRIENRLMDDALIQPLVNPVIDTALLAHSLREATQQTWVAKQDSRIVGHLYGALLDNETYGNGVWIGPDGASFINTDVLSDLYLSLIHI